MKSIPRFPPRQKRADGTFGCRGCGGIIPKGRKTWCSRACVREHDPFYVKQAVKDRCNSTCEMCGKDCSRQAQQLHREQKPREPHYLADCLLSFPYDFQAFRAHPLHVAYRSEWKIWHDIRPEGEFDHIIPHSEGGKFTPDNIRFICVACHKARTRLWHKERKLKTAAP